MLTFIVNISEQALSEAHAQGKTITSATLYELLLNQWLRHEFDRAHPRGGLPGLDLEQRWRAVTELAMMFWHRTGRTLNILELPEEMIRAVKELSSNDLNPEQVRHQIGAGTLLVRDEGNNFSFIHWSVMEWLVAKAVAQQLHEGVTPEALGVRELSPLMADFVCELAGRTVAERWAQQALETTASSTIQKNASLMLDRLGR